MSENCIKQHLPSCQEELLWKVCFLAFSFGPSLERRKTVKQRSSKLLRSGPSHSQRWLPPLGFAQSNLLLALPTTTQKSCHPGKISKGRLDIFQIVITKRQHGPEPVSPYDSHFPGPLGMTSASSSFPTLPLPRGRSQALLLQYQSEEFPPAASSDSVSSWYFMSLETLLSPCVKRKPRRRLGKSGTGGRGSRDD